MVFMCIMPIAGDLNILVVGAGDSRHLLKTMAHAYRHPKRTINVSISTVMPKHIIRITITS